MEIKVLGSGCTRCNILEQNTRKAVEELGIEATIEKIEDIQKILDYEIMMTPGLIVNGKVLVSGRILSVNQVKKLLIQNQ